MPQSASQTLVLFFLIAAGFAAGKLRVIDGDTRRGLSRILVNFILPALIVASMQKPLSPELRAEAFFALGLSFAVYAASFPLAFLFARLIRARGEEAGVHAFACVFSNVAFMGFPVLEAIFGKESLFTAAIYNIPFQLLAFSIGASMLAGRKGGRPGLSLASFFTPAGVASFAGFALFFLEVSLPSPLLRAMSLLGDTTTPLAMLLIGSTLAGASLRSLFLSPRIYLTSAYRLLLFPFALYLVLSRLGLSGRMLGMPVAIAAMPVAANASILAEAYGGDAETASALVFVSTALSLVTLPLVSGGLFGA